MSIDTAHPRETLERPSMPIESRTEDDWAFYYHRRLSNWFHACHKRHATPGEWDHYITRQFSLQITVDETP